MGRLTKYVIDEYLVEDFNYDSVFGMNYKDYLLFCDVVDKLAHYEDLEAQGRLIELPCAVGDTVWVIEEGFKDISSIPTKYYYIEENPYDFYMYYAVGDWIFLTKEEAEAKLKELEA